MKITIAQINPHIQNYLKILTDIKTVIKQNGSNSDLIVFPELTTAGYPAKDLLLRDDFLDHTENIVNSIKKESLNYPKVGVIIGTPLRRATGLKNAALFIQNGKVIHIQEKQLLPTYDVFDEDRYFKPGQGTHTFIFSGKKIGIIICEDAWFHDSPKKYTINPIDELASQNPELVCCIMASPYEMGKSSKRSKLFKKHARTLNCPIVMSNQVGGVDDLVFDGQSGIITPKNEQLMDRFFEGSATFDLDNINDRHVTDNLDDLQSALELGIRDYVRKCGFKSVILGLSGGIDSAVVATLAVGALGAENVMGVLLPSKYSSKGSIEDSEVLAQNLGIQYQIIQISDVVESLEATLKPALNDTLKPVTEENLQARSRGVILMALSNQTGSLLLTTGNKSEVAIGYCTLYGDMNGGFAPISDCPKTLVYDLAKHINKDKEIIPKSTLTKEPSAELRPDQKDSDTLPPYEILDAILAEYVVKHASEQDIIRQGYDQNTVRWVIAAVNKNEYKRQQAAPGIKISPRAFGFGRREVISKS